MSQAIGHAAVVSLINAVAEHPTLVVDVVKENLLSTAMEALQDPSCEIREVLVMLLSNLSADPNFASQLMQEHTELEVPHACGRRECLTYIQASRSNGISAYMDASE
jgi:hypothetical protein